MRTLSETTVRADLSAGLDLTVAKRLTENANAAFMGDTKGGPFDIPEAVAQDLLAAPNPDGRSNSDVVRPWVNASDIGGRPRGMWIIDFPPGTSEQEAALYEAPFEYVVEHVKPQRDSSRTTIDGWWMHERPRVEMRAALGGLGRQIVTPRVAKHRIFVWMPVETIADSATIAIARDDDLTFGVLQSRVYEAWARRKGTQLRERESGFRYKPTTTFETFPFPRPDRAQRVAIEDAAKNLVQLRDGWLRARPDRTLTGLYNEQPTWLQHAKSTLDEAVMAAFGWVDEPPRKRSCVGSLT